MKNTFQETFKNFFPRNDSVFFFLNAKAFFFFDNSRFCGVSVEFTSLFIFQIARLLKEKKLIWKQPKKPNVLVIYTVPSQNS